MRLPWPFSRRDDEAEAEAGVGPGGAPPSSASPAPVGTDRVAPPTGAWAALPPIQRAVGQPPLVAPAAPFLERVPGAQPLPPIVEALGHDVTPIAPAGIVAAPVHAVPALTSSASLVPPPVQRRAGHGAATDDVPAATHVTEPGVAEGAPAVSTTSAAPELPAIEPPRRLGIVPEPATARPPERPLTRAEARPAGPPLVVARRADAPNASPSSPAPAHAAPTMRTSRPAAAADADSRETAPLAEKPLVARSTARTSTSAAPDPAGPPAAATLPPAAGGRPRRVGLGAPLTAPPSTAVPVTGASPAPRRPSMTVARTPESPAALTGADTGPAQPRGFRATAGASPLRTTIQRRAAASEPESGSEPGSDHGPTAGPTALPSSAPLPRPSLPVLRAVRPAGGADGHDHDQAETGGAEPRTGDASARGLTAPGTVTPVQRALARTSVDGPSRHAPETPPRRPLVGARRPIAVAPVQRTADGVLPPHAEPTARAHGLESGLPSSDGAATPRSVTGSAFAEAAAPPAVATFSDPSAPTRPGLALQRSAGSGPPSGVGFHGPAATSAPVLRVPPRPASLPLAQGATAASSGIIAATPGPVVQALPQAAPTLAPTATAVVQRVDGAAPPAPTESEGHSESDLDDLARKLFGRFQNRLRAELIYEREAKGLSFDN